MPGMDVSDSSLSSEEPDMSLLFEEERDGAERD